MTRQGRRRASNLVLGFAVRAAVAFLAVGIVAHVFLSTQVQRRYAESARFIAEFVARSVVEDELRPDDASRPMTDSRYAELLGFVEAHVLTGDVFRVKLWRADGTVLFSDARSLVGKRFPREVPQLRDIIRRGAVRHEVSDLQDVEDRQESWEAETAFETYVPLDTGPGGERVVLEVYQDRAPTIAGAASFTRVLDASLVVGLGALYALVLPIARRANRTLADQTDQLASQNEELEALLDREQQTVHRLEELAELKDRFLTSVSHELRTPLTVIRSGAQTLANRWESLDPAVRVSLLERVVVQGARVANVLDDLFDLNRLRGHAVQPRRDVVPLAAVVDDVLAAEEAGADVSVDVPGRVAADRDHVESIVAHLVRNAVRHTPPGTPVEIRARRDGGDVLLAVEDRGPGIPDALKLGIFEPFRQGPSPNDHNPGSGIGLSLVRELARVNGGDAWVEDRRGGGASFRVRLPAPDPVPADDRPVGVTA